MYLGSIFNLYAGFLALAIVGLLLALRTKAAQVPMAFVLGFCACSFLAAAVGFHFWRNYFILLLPGFALLIGMAVGLIQQILQSKTTRMAAAMTSLFLFMTVFIWNVAAQRDVFFQMSGNQICQAIYPNQPFVESVAVAKYLRENSPENARLAVLGSEPQIYFYTRRHSVTGYIYTYALTEDQPYAGKMQRQMIKEIEDGRPEYLVQVFYEYSWGPPPSPQSAIFSWLHEYIGKFYHQVGVVGIRHSGEIVSSFEGDGEIQIDSLRHYLLIYKRKPSEQAGASVKN
jgi:hypothetical protein